jgi:hypothetical protein
MRPALLMTLPHFGEPGSRLSPGAIGRRAV